MPKAQHIVESSIIALLFFSLFVSKSGIYIGLSLLLIYQMYTLYKNKLHLHEEKQNLSTITIVSVGLFGLGILINLPFSGEFNDLGDYFRKCALLLLFPLLIISLKRNNNLQVVYTAVIISLIAALCYSLFQFSSIGLVEWKGQRIPSFWDIGRWGEILGYCLAILVPFILECKLQPKEKAALSILLLASIFCLLLSGGRAPLVAITMTIGVYLCIRKPKLAVACIFLTSGLLLFGQNISSIATITNRLISIINLSGDYSNIARLTMWEYGLKFTLHNLQHEPFSFLFGTGITNMESSYVSFLHSTTDVTALSMRTNNNFSMTDMHNTFLDLLVRLGAVYVIGFITLLGLFFKFFFQQRHLFPEYAYPGMCLIATFSITGMFYTSGLEFQFTVFLAFVALLYAQIIKDSTSNE